MRTHLLLAGVFTLFILAGCRKDSPLLPSPTANPAVATSGGITTPDRGAALAFDASLGQIISEDGSQFKTYVIPAGQNYCVGNTYAVDTFWGMNFQAIFDSSCIYNTADPANQADINKLFGFSDSSSHHHQNSARFGWNWQDGALHIYGYCYRSGMRQSTEICTVALGVPHTFSIELRAGQYFFGVDNQHFALMERAAQVPYAFGYSLLPYFGGDEPAPHEVRIKIRELPSRP
jgi:hypothetical protein